jgi:predicted dinucleotide-binding enzyme
LVVLAVHQPAVDGVLAELGDALAGKVVVDVTNRVDPANPGSTMDGTSAAEQIQARAPGARVVKAFNTAFASRQADPVVDGIALDAFIAGDDDQAKQAVAELAGAIGFRPIDAGPLVMARALEAMALLNITLQLRHNWPWQAGFKLVGPTA